MKNPKQTEHGRLENENEVNGRIHRAFSHAAPDVLQEIKSRCEGRAPQGAVVLPSRRPRWNVRVLGGIAAAFLFLLAGVTSFVGYQQNYTVSSVVSIDVNPSIQLGVSAKGKVLNSAATNADATAILEGLTLEGLLVEDALESVVASLVGKGYLSAENNSVLISVENSNRRAAAKMEERVATNISEHLEKAEIKGAVLSQIIEKDDGTLEALARENGISKGKAKMIREMTEDEEEFKRLSGKKVHELNVIRKQNGKELYGVTHRGEPNEEKYIGVEAAIDAALADAGLTREEAEELEIKMDFRSNEGDDDRDDGDGDAVYYVTFAANGTRYQYEIDALTGEALERKESSNARPATPAPEKGEGEMPPHREDEDKGKNWFQQHFPFFKEDRD